MTGSILKLNKPYPYNDSLRDRIAMSLLFSAFVFIFLRLFQPFEISNLGKSLTSVVLGYALVCFFTMIILNVIIAQLFSGFFTETKWTTGKEIIWTTVNVGSIGLFNFLYSVFIGVTDFRFPNLLMFLGFTIAVAAFPLTIAILLNQVRLNRKYSNESRIINTSLNENVKKSIDQDYSILRIPNENNEVVLEVALSDLLFIKSDDNYIEVNHLVQGKRTKKLIRNTLKNIQQSCIQSPQCYRCHKSYLVNLSLVRHISGNSQGYKLHLDGITELIPVSRSNNDFVKNYFSKHP